MVRTLSWGRTYGTRHLGAYVNPNNEPQKLQDAERTKSRPGGAQPVDHDPDIDTNQSDVGPGSS